MRQEVARSKQNWSLENVVLQTVVTNKEKEQIKDPPAEGVYVYGLFLEGTFIHLHHDHSYNCGTPIRTVAYVVLSVGCAWDKANGRLLDSPPKVLFCSVPVLYITAVL